MFDPQLNNPGAATAGDVDGGPAWWLYVLLAVVAIAAVATTLLWWLPQRARGPKSPRDRAIWELELALRRSGRTLETGTTLRQLEHRLGTDEASAYLRALSASRYGPTPRSPTAAERRSMRRALAQGLGWGGRLRAFWALPPRR
jgi:hypothetical protein